MKKTLVLAVAALLLALAVPGDALARRHGGVVVGGFVVGGPWWWGPPWWDPFWYPYPYPAYAPPVIIEQQPQTYVQQQPAPQGEPYYWYYCADAKAYYPYVQQCPGGWLKVVPQTAPPPK